MRKHTTHDTAPAIADNAVDYSALAAELEAIDTRLHNATRGFSTDWPRDEFEATEAALQAVKDALVDAAVKHFAPAAIAAAWHAGGPDNPRLPKGFPLCPLLQQGTIQADISNAWRIVDLAIDAMRSQWEAPELRNCMVLLFGALAVIEAAETKVADSLLECAVIDVPPWQEDTEADQAPAPALSDRDRAEERDRQANASRLADFASGRAESDRLARAAALELMKQARPAPVPSLQGHEFQRLAVELEQASSLLTDAACAMSGGWTMKELERCDSMVSGARALIDQGRARLERADADYVRALQPDQGNDEAGEGAQP